MWGGGLWCGMLWDWGVQCSSIPSSLFHCIPNKLCSMRPSRQHVSLKGIALSWSLHNLDAASQDRPAPWAGELRLRFFPSWVSPGNLSLRQRKFLS